jgi:membrane-bound serine protease (ClpP class)
LIYVFGIMSHSFDQIITFLTNPVVTTLLLIIASVGLIASLFAPRLGLLGMAGLLCLFLFYFSHYFSGTAGVLSFLLLSIGILLILAEFVLPGAIAGTLGLISIALSVMVAGTSLIQMGISVLIALILGVVTMILMVKVMGRQMNFFKKMVLLDSTSTEKGYVSNVNRIELINQIGITLTPLRPSGMIKINEERVDAVTEGGYIQQGKQVKVLKVEGSRIIVRESEV